MIEISDITQNAVGKDNSQIGVQYNHEEHHHNGLSVGDAVEIAFKLFREQYPQFQAEVLQELRRMVTQELIEKAPQKIVTPSPRIVVNSLQSASNTEESDVRKMYAKLLASSMDSETSQHAHPAFPKIIDQMNAFDAKLLQKVVDINDSIPVAVIRFVFGSKYLTNAMPHYYSPFFDDLRDPWATSFSIENLARLQLINLFEGTVNTYDYEKFKTEPFVLERFEASQRNNPARNFVINVDKYVIQQNDFGRRFSKICMED